jgi:UDP-N-acetyl-D-mannosaminuronic acid dehydrogenase
LENGKLKAGRDFYLAYSPERAMPTKILPEIQSNGRIIGGINEESAMLAKELYSAITKGDILIGEIRTVEMAKIIENTYRDVNIALANEIAMLCEKFGVDAIKAIKMANTHPRVHMHMPGAGVGGNCIPKDPYFLISKAEELGVKLNVISAARKVNKSMPKHLVGLVEKALEKVNKKIKDAKVSVLGIAYKGNTSDVRKSPSKDLIKALLKRDCKVFSHDPYTSHDFGGKFSNDLMDAIKGADCLVIVTDHDEYKRLDLKKIASTLAKPGIIVDGRRILDPKEVEEEGMLYFGVGIYNNV